MHKRVLNVSLAIGLGTVPCIAPSQGTQRADVPAPRTDSNSMLAHRQLLAKRTQGRIHVY